MMWGQRTSRGDGSGVGWSRQAAGRRRAGSRPSSGALSARTTSRRNRGWRVSGSSSSAGSSSSSSWVDATNLHNGRNGPGTNKEHTVATADRASYLYGGRMQAVAAPTSGAAMLRIKGDRPRSAHLATSSTGTAAATGRSGRTGTSSRHHDRAMTAATKVDMATATATAMEFNQQPLVAPPKAHAPPHPVPVPEPPRNGSARRSRHPFRHARMATTEDHFPPKPPPTVTTAAVLQSASTTPAAVQRQSQQQKVAPLSPDRSAALVAGTSATTSQHHESKQQNQPRMPTTLARITYDALGTPVVRRTSEERAKQPQRVDLDRRGLTSCPLIHGEPDLRLLNLESNSIASITQMHTYSSLIFLDLYCNRIKRISGLSGVPTLRVLMLGKNEITQIEGLEALRRLDVLDLHGNQITKVQNLRHLHELRVLNLAGNRITVLNNVGGLYSLAELNLRRNRITGVSGIHGLSALQRVFLSDNAIHSFDEIAPLFKIQNLAELALDGNPVASNREYRAHLLQSIQSVRNLDMSGMDGEPQKAGTARGGNDDAGKGIDEETAHSVDSTEEIPQSGQDSALKARANRGVNEAAGATAADAARVSMDLSSRGAEKVIYELKARDEKLSAIAAAWKREYALRSEVSPGFTADSNPGTEAVAARRAALPSHWEWDEAHNRLHIWGMAFRALTFNSSFHRDRDVFKRMVNTVTSVHFFHAPLEDIVVVASSKLKAFPNLNHICLSNNGVHSLFQLDMIGVFGLPSISVEDNSVCDIPLFRAYLLACSKHVQVINDVPVTSEDRRQYKQVFGALRQLWRRQYPPIQDPNEQEHVERSCVKSSGVRNSSASRSAADPDNLPVMQTVRNITASRRKAASARVNCILQDVLQLDEKLASLRRVFPTIVKEHIAFTLYG